MEKFGENVRGGATFIICPLCNTHLDNQDISFTCPVTRKDKTKVLSVQLGYDFG